MNFAWISLVCLTFIWFRVTGIYEPASPDWIIFLLLALFCASLGNSYPGKSFSERVKKSCLQCGAILLAQGAVFPFVYILLAKNHFDNLFTTPLSFLLNLLGLKTVGEGYMLYISTNLQTIQFASAWEKMGLFYFILFLVGGCALLAVQRARGLSYLVLGACTLSYMLLRYTALIVVYTRYPVHSIFWQYTVTLITLLFLAFLLGRLFKEEVPVPTSIFKDKYNFKDKYIIISALLGFLVVCTGMTFLYGHDPGVKKSGVILVDEYHSDWEWTDEAYDENWFGERSGYNYYCFYDYISKFYTVSRNEQPITSNALQGVDVLILKTPTTPYTTEEINTVTDYVKKGGGLYLIGDHTNVFGTGTNLNKLATNFDIRFNYDCTYELTAGNLSSYDAPKILTHPALNNLPHFLFATSCTLQTSWLANDLMVGYGLKTFPADYSQRNFFPEDSNSGLVTFGCFVQSSATSYGTGRVLAFTDSTVFSNFWMFMRGKPELLLLSLQWLNQENALPVSVKAISLAALPVLLIILILYLGLYHKKHKLILPCLVGALTALIISTALFSITGRAAKLPEPIVPFTQICFEDEYSNMRLPLDINGFLSNADQLLSTFYVWNQRLGYVPSLENTLSAAMATGDIVVITKPKSSLTELSDADLNQIAAYVDNGGVLLVMSNQEYSANSAQLLKKFDLQIVAADLPDTILVGQPLAENNMDIPLTPNASAVLGGEQLITDEQGNSIFSIAPYGKGAVAVFTDPDLFYNNEMGDVSANLTEKTRQITNLEFNMMKYLVGTF